MLHFFLTTASKTAQNLPKHGSSSENVSLPCQSPNGEGVPFSPLTPRFLSPNQAYWIRFYISREIQTDSEHCILASAAAAELISDRWYLLFIRLAGTGVIEAVLRSRLAQMHRRRAAVENWLPWKKTRSRQQAGRRMRGRTHWWTDNSKT